MVYAGRNRACARCRSIKKKCDQKRPDCERCKAAKVQCHGYRDEFELLYRDKRAKAKARAIAAIAPKAGELSSPGHLSQTKRVERQTSPSQTLSAYRLSISTSTSRDVVAFFFQQFSFPAKSCGMFMWMSILPEYDAVARDDSCFKLALLAAAYAYQTAKAFADQNTARAFYVSALKAVSQALDNSCYKNSTVLAIALLDTFGLFMEDSGLSLVHIDGLKAVLAIKNRHSERRNAAQGKAYTSPENFVFDFHPQLRALTTDVQYRKTPSEETIRWVEGLEHGLGGPNVSRALLRFAQVSALSSQLCSAIRAQMLESHDKLKMQLNVAELMTLIQVSEMIDENNKDWHQVSNSKWKIVRQRNSLRYNAGGLFPDYVDSYHDIWTACVWNAWRAGRIVLHDTIIECSESLKSVIDNLPQAESLAASVRRARDIIANSLKDIQRSFPYIAGRVDSEGNPRDDVEATVLSGQYSLWPLNVIHQCKSIDMADRDWAREMLLEVGRITGVRRAWVLAKRNMEEAVVADVLDPTTR